MSIQEIDLAWRLVISNVDLLCRGKATVELATFDIDCHCLT